MSLEELKQKDGELISQKEAVRYSGWSPGYLKKLMEAGAIRCYITLGGEGQGV